MQFQNHFLLLKKFFKKPQNGRQARSAVLYNLTSGAYTTLKAPFWSEVELGTFGFFEFFQ